MDNAIIRSRQNALVKRARAVRDRHDHQDQIFIEGLRLSEEAAGSRLVILDALFTEKFQSEERGARLLNRLKAAGARLSLLSEDVLDFVSDTRAPQGIILLALRPPTGRERLLAELKPQDAGDEQPSPTGIPLIVIIHGINNPANAGAIIRTAEAAGATGVISIKGTTDLFSPKALRGSMGSCFRLLLWAGADFSEAIEWCREQGIQSIGASVSATKAYVDADWAAPSALVIGSEAAGLSLSEVEMLDEAIRIPMRPPVESLNAAVASGIILYEAARQRRAAGTK